MSVVNVFKYSDFFQEEGIRRVIRENLNDCKCVYEFHEYQDVDQIYNWQSGIEGFREKNHKFYDSNLFIGLVDDWPAMIHYAVNINNEWYVLYWCGANFYGGSGPTATIAMRDFCLENHLSLVVHNEDFSDWFQANFPNHYFNQELQLEEKQDGFEKVLPVRFEKELTALYDAGISLSRSSEFAGDSESKLRDTILAILQTHNIIAFGEVYSGSGKSDIYIKSSDGEFPFELKIGTSQSKLKEGLDQLLERYVQPSHSEAGLVFFNKINQLSKNIPLFIRLIKERFNVFPKKWMHTRNMFYCEIPHPNDSSDTLTLFTLFIDLKSNG